MIEAHVACLASLRLAGFFRGKRVPRMTGIALRRSELSAGAVFAQFRNLDHALVANLVAPPASFFALGHCHRLPVNRRHSLHRRPGHGVLAFLELRDLGFVTLGAGFRRRYLCFRYIAGRGMLIAMTCNTGNFSTTVFAKLPIRHNVGSDLVVAVDALRRGGGLGSQ